MTTQNKDPLEQLLTLLPQRVAAALTKLPGAARAKLTEITLPRGFPVYLTVGGETRLLGSGGYLTADPAAGVTLPEKEMEDTLLRFCGGSVYACGEQLRRGCLPLPGGARAGIAGRAVPDGRGGVQGVAEVSALRIRLARAVEGAAAPLLSYVLREGRLRHTLLVSPPGGGKTTLLRDLCRLLSDGGCRLVAVDGKGELAGMREGRPTLDVGRFTCVLEGWPKEEGVRLALLNLGPQGIVCDEVANGGEAAALCEAAGAGAAVLTALHGGSVEELFARPLYRQLRAAGLDETVVLLGGPEDPGRIRKILQRRDGDASFGDDPAAVRGDGDGNFAEYVPAPPP